MPGTSGFFRGRGDAIEVEGVDEFKRALRRMGGSVKDLNTVNRKAAKPVLDRARELAPRRSGKLRRSIRLTATKGTAHILAGGRDGVVYAGPIHFGWFRRNIEPQPFLYDALDDRRKDVLDIYNSHIEGLVRKFDAETPDI